MEALAAPEFFVSFHGGNSDNFISGSSRIRVHANFRDQGLGGQMFTWVIKRAKERECQLVQLTSDKQRPDALRFYENLGFEATHEGLKLKL